MCPSATHSLRACYSPRLERVLLQFSCCRWVPGLVQACGAATNGTVYEFPFLVDLYKGGRSRGDHLLAQVRRASGSSGTGPCPAP